MKTKHKVAAGLTAGTLGAAALFIGNRSLLAPIRQISGVMEKWRSGETTARTAMTGPDELSSMGARLDALLDETAHRQGLDFLLLLDPQGRVRAGAGSEGADRSGWTVVRSALRGEGTHGLDVLEPEHLDAIDPSLPARTLIPLVHTRNAASTARSVEDRALTIHAAVPIFGLDGEILGVLEGGMLLNGSQTIVDRINTVVYQEASLPLGSQGTATLFLDDTRIATNVRLFEGERALGTRASAAVYRRVMGEGRVWLGSAFVVDDTYVSGYEPLLDTGAPVARWLRHQLQTRHLLNPATAGRLELAATGNPRALARAARALLGLDLPVQPVPAAWC